MRYANQIDEMINAFSPEPLKVEQMDEFYCSDTMEFRMSDKYSSPMEDIFDICQEGEGHNAFLLLGHKGCGKSTELNRLSMKFASQGYKVETIVYSMDLDMFNIVYSDLFVLMGEALLKIAKESGCEMSKNILDNIMNFWSEGIETTASQKVETASIETEMSVGTIGVLNSLL